MQTPSVNMQWTQAFLEQIKAQYPDHEHIVVWDGAGFHPKDASHEMIPEGIHIVTLPPYSPDEPHRETLGFDTGSHRKQALAHNRATRQSRWTAPERMVGRTAQSHQLVW